jgi:hypothetical protein
VPVELAAVVGESFSLDIVWEGLRYGLMQVCCVCAASRRLRIGEGHVRFGVDGGEDLALDPLALTYHRIQGHALKALELNAFGFSGTSGACKALALPSRVGHALVRSLSGALVIMRPIVLTLCRARL